eukprot:CAMPEP_0178375006 /NCGR_PEP_ID=MMETSP0689_2-20121128/2665_1 /TAXON_ID=160604 /ORGANISM="Amphidinium massartii, Strain CS-259" /LENGTH=1208 /DNA_ID=CAMNT_0019994985 /DNA_START=84 /DNA_END=3710 /DNA_ORIENTATION=+
MEVLAALGLGAKELFTYNRENFKFDQDQRLERETLRLEMQVKRFELFREDIRDLVELTVDRMDVYHLVGALFLEFCIVLFCEGRVQASAPPFLLSLFLLSNACAFIYLLLAVWLSMHASIASHSFGVRLLTRFVRLPIPSIKQINSLRSQLRDYERQGVANLLRMPFQHTVAGSGHEWYSDEKDEQEKKLEEKMKDKIRGKPDAEKADLQQAGPGLDNMPLRSQSTPAHPKPDSPSKEQPRGIDGQGLKKAASEYFVPGRAGPGEGGGLPAKEAELSQSPAPTMVGKSAQPPDMEASPQQPLGLRPRRTKSAPSDPFVVQPLPQQAPRGDSLLPEEAESPFGGEDLLSGRRGALPERHVQLFRQLQSKWQCYDAYCRVCMGLGVNQILQGLSYYAVCHTLVENRSPTTGYAMVALFQCTTVALAVLDLAGLRRREIIAIQVVGMMPCVLTAWGVAHGKREESGVLDAEESYPLSPLSFLFQVLWLELWLRVAQPTDMARLPRRFRQVLFLDVFGDAYSGWDPGMDDGEGPSLQDVLNAHDNAGEAAEPVDSEVSVSMQQAMKQLALAQWAVRRWNAVPDWAMNAKQRKELDFLRDQLHTWGNSIKMEMDRCANMPGAPDMHGIFEERLRRWDELSEEERSADPFASCLTGPFEHDCGYTTQTYHYSLENSQTLFDDAPSKVCPGALVLEQQAVKAIVTDLETMARRLLEVRIMYDLRVTEYRRMRERLLRERGGMHQPTIKEEEDDEPSRLRCGPPSFRQPSAAAKANFPNLVNMLKDRRKNKRGARDDAEGTNLLSSPPPTPGLGYAQVASMSPPPAIASPSGSGSKRDPTLVAMAGQHAMHFVPERLPWQVLSHMTRVLQVCWFYTCLMALLKEMGIYQVDYQQHPGHERRLHTAVSDPWIFDEVKIHWPHGSFFHPEGVSCFPDHERALVMSSPFALYSAFAEPNAEGWFLQEMLRYRVPPSSVAVCHPSGSWHSRSAEQAWSQASACQLMTPTEDGVRLWPLGEEAGGDATSTLALQGPSWRLLAGAVTPCSLVSSLLPVSHQAAEWCFIFAGWDGEMLPVAVMPLTGNSSDTAAGVFPAGSELLPSLDVPLPASESRKGIVALHIEPETARLWALLKGGVLMAWDLVRLRALGRWRLHWRAHSDTFHPVAFCGNAEDGFFAVGRSDHVGPLLMRSAGSPSRLEDILAHGSASDAAATDDVEMI